MTLGELNHSRSPLCWLAWAVLHTLLKRSSREGTPDLNLLFQYNMPVRALAQMTGGMVGQETVDGIVWKQRASGSSACCGRSSALGRTQSPTGSSARYWTPSAGGPAV